MNLKLMVLEGCKITDRSYYRRVVNMYCVVKVSNGFEPTDSVHYVVCPSSPHPLAL